MPQLPSAADLGQVNPGSGERPIGQINAEPIARGYERMGQGLSELGQGVGELEVAKSRHDYALAHGGFLSDMIGLDESTRRDLNYGPDDNGQDLSQRYATQANAIRDKWAASLGNPFLRGRFTEIAGETVARGQSMADTHAFGLYKDHQVAATDTLGEDLGNKAVATDDPKVHAQVMDAYGNAVDALAGRGFITQDQAVGKKRAFGGNLAQGLLLQQAQTDPQGALNHIRAAPGSDAELGERIIQVESGGNPNSRDPNSSAAGLGSFTNSTWLDLIKSQHPELAKGRSDQDLLALRADPGLQREMVGALIAKNRASLQAQGLEANAGNLYLAHFLGSGGAAALLKAKPDTPVAELLDPKAIASNPTILAGRTAGSVEKWASDKMGGYSPGEGSIYSFIPPQQRAQLEARLSQMTTSKRASDSAQFKSDQQDSESEALNTGDVKNPIPQERFIAEYGPTDGPRLYQDYDIKVQTGKTIAGFAQMTPDQRQTAIDSLTPQRGEPGEAAKWQAKKVAQEAADHLAHEIKADPAAFAQQRLPAVQDAWANLQAAQSGQNTAMTPQDAARHYVGVTTMEQQRAGVPASEVRVAPKAYTEQLAAALKNPVPAGGSGAVLDRITNEAKLWGDAWPQVYREIAPKLDPTMRVVASGVDAAAGRLLIENHDTDVAKILGTQHDTDKKTVEGAAQDALKPVAKTFLSQDTRADYTATVAKLTALYAARGVDPKQAATQAVNELIGQKYDFADTYRVPHESGVTGDQVAAGVAAAKANMATLDLAPARDDLGIGPDYVRNATPAALARDGKWVTDPNEHGLMLSQNGRLWPSKADPTKPFMLTWAQLRDMGVKRASQPVTPVPAAGLSGANAP
jgi:hypothetical protein